MDRIPPPIPLAQHHPDILRLLPPPRRPASCRARDPELSQSGAEEREQGGHVQE